MVSLCRGAAMALVGAQVAEAAAALLAAVRSGTAVDPLMCVKVAQLFEAPAALWAGVGALTCVDPLVSLQAGEYGESLPTLGTGEGALGAAVAQPVALEAGGMAEPFPALRADEGFLTCMDALMLAQVAQVVKMAPTVAALVATLYFLFPGAPTSTYT